MNLPQLLLSKQFKGIFLIWSLSTWLENMAFFFPMWTSSLFFLKFFLPFSENYQQMRIHCFNLKKYLFQLMALQRPCTPGSGSGRNQEPGARTFNTSHKFSDQSLSCHYQCCLEIFEAVYWHNFQCCYSYNML